MRSHVRLVVLSEDELAVYHEYGVRTIPGRLLPLIVPHIDGRRSTDDIAERLDDRATFVDVCVGLAILEEEGLLCEADDRTPEPLGSYIDGLEADHGSFLDWRSRVAVSVRPVEPMSPEPFVTALESVGLTVADDGRFTLVVTDDYLRPELAAFSDAARVMRAAWMPVKPVGRHVWIGPVFESHDGPCWRCLASRLAEQRGITGGSRVLEIADPSGHAAPQPSVPSSIALAAHATALMVLARAAAHVPAQFEPCVVTIDTGTLETRRHVVARLPYCQGCGAPDRSRQVLPPPVVLAARPRRPLDDAHGASAADTLRAFNRHVSPITGIVRSLVSSRPVASDAIHVCVADFVFPRRARRADDPAAPRPWRKSAGKGRTEAGARASALCEALERYSGIFRGNEPRRLATLAELGDTAIHPQACLTVSETQYRQRDALNAEGYVYTWVPERFDEGRAIEWTPLWSLTGNCRTFLPTAYCYYGYDGPGHHEFCRADSNGTAAGSSVEDAILHAFLELAERDAVAIWWYNRIERPQVDLDTVVDPYVAEIRDVYRRLKRSIRVFEITNDLATPVFAAVSNGIRRGADDLIYGFGAAMDSLRALSRALGEMNQFLPEVVSDSLRRRLSQTLDDDRFLRAKPGRGPKDVSMRDRPRWPGSDVRDDIHACLQRAAACGLDVLVLNQTRPEIGAPVARVVVPGLRHFWPRLGPGRLYTVPVQLGWLETARDERDLTRAAFLI